MSQTIDHRIVEMRFVNKEFESNAKQTMSTLTKLKEALKLPQSEKAFEGLDKSVKDIKLDGIAAGVEALERRFSTLGIVGMRVIENITDGLMNKLRTAVNFVTDSIVSGGIKRAMNIENAHFQLQALLKDETKVQAVMADAMESVDGTAYAYDEAAKAASQFAASGIQAGEEMLGALKGITGVAAMTNSSFEDISTIFTTVAGNGRLMGDQLLQLSSRGLNAASTLADYFKEVRGQSNMTEAAIREMVSKGQISFKDFSDAMTWAFGDSAKRANETFNGALSNMKSALARIGAGFISPLIEQNGELVQLFNALRIKINDVKSALVFEEARSALAGLTEQSDLLFDNMTKIVKDGSVGFEEITNAIFGTSKSEKELAALNEKLSTSFNDVKENGAASVQTLIDFKSNGIDAAKSVREYINGVLDGTIQVSEATKNSIKEISGGVKLVSGDVLKMAEDGKISYDIFTEAIVKTSGVVEKESKFTTDTITNMMAAVKENGSVTSEALIEFNANGMNAATALRKYMNGVLDGSIRASYATKQAIEEITGGTAIAAGDILKFAEEGKIGFDIFQSAMEEAYGTEKTLSKQFTDAFLDTIKTIVTAINEADMTKPMEVFYYWVEIIKNVSKGLFSIIKPIGKAFSETFLSFDTGSVISFSEAVEKLTSKLKLSEKGSKNLQDAFKGLFSIVKLVIDIFFKLLSAILPINRPIVEMGGGFLGLAGSIGRALTAFTDITRSSTLLKKAFNGFQKGFSLTMDGLAGLIKIGKNFISVLSGMEGTTKLINAVTRAFDRLGSKAIPYIDDFINEIEKFLSSVFKIEDIKLDDILNTISNAFSDLAWEIDHFSFKTIEQGVDVLRQKLKALTDLAMSNEGISTFVTNFKHFGEQLKDAFALDNLLDRLERIMDIFGEFFRWVKNTMAPAFEDFNFGSVAAAGGGFGIIYTMIKAAKALEKMSNSITAVPDLLNAVKGTLVSYQKDLKADALIKTAGAIAILAGALVLLSFADTDRIMEAAVALSLIAGTLLLGVSKLLDAANKGKELNSALRIFSKGLSSTMKKLGRAVEIKALGGAVKKFAESIAIIAVSIIALGFMYSKDKEAFMAGVELVKQITIALVAIMAGMSILGNLLKGGGMTNFSKAAFGILSLSASLTLCIAALNKLFKMEFPPDWKFKIAVLAGLLGGLGVLAIALGVASRISGKNKVSSGMILSTAALLMTTVIALDKLFKMEFPPDWKTKVTVLGLIFASFGALMVTMGVASKLAGGSIKAAGTILSMCVFVAVIVAALMVLTLIPAEKLVSGAIALGTVLTTLGLALYGAGQITKKDTYKSILTMAITVGTITAALAVLSMIPFSKLLKGATALGSILIILAENFKQVSKMTNEKAWLSIMAMIAAILGITYSLYTLSEQPWSGLLAGAVSLSAVLLSLAQSLKMISGMSGLKIEKISLFLLATTSLIPIGVALYALSNQPWDGILASAAALSGVIYVFSQAMKTISALRGIKIEKISLFLLASLSLVPIGVALYALSNQPWENLLASAGSISLVLLAMSGAMVVCSLVGSAAPAALTGIGLLDLFIANFALVLVALGALFQSEGARALMSGGAEILIGIGEAIGGFVGAIVKGALTGISSSLPQIGIDLSNFMTNLQPFIEGSKNIDTSALANIGLLAGVILALTAAEVISGIASLFGLSLTSVATELSDFMIALEPFLQQAKTLDESSMKACGYLADMIIKLTAAELITGIGNFLGISGSLADFASELEAFGPSIAAFANTVKDVNPEAVQGAASAASIMAEVAGKLQGHGGLWQDIVGDRSLADFASELEAFGPSIAAFANTVKDVNPEAVQGAASAASIMAEVANNLPEGESLKSKIFGSSISLSEFGNQLSSFAVSLIPFCTAVQGITPESVQGAASAVEIMTTVANNLPNSETLWSKIFGGGQVTLSEFGEELTQFGYSMSNFSSSVSGINSEAVNAAITSFKELVNLASNMQGANAGDLINFANQLGQVGGDSVDKFVQAFSEAGPKVTVGITNMIVAITTAIQNQNAVFITQGSLSIDQYLVGIRNKYPEASTVGLELAVQVLTSLQLKISEFLVKGASSASQYLQGFRNKYNEASSTGASLANNALSGCRNTTSGFYQAGAQAGNGFVEGLRSNIDAAAAAGTAIGNAALKAAKEALSIHSPSRKMMEVGDNTGIGFVGQLLRYVSKAAEAGKKLGNATYSGISQVMTDFDISDPVIRPSVDLGGVTESFKEVKTMFDSAVKSSAELALSASSSFQRNQPESISSGSIDTKTSGGTNITYNQYNTSPKALSQIEIYRQTRNQLSKFKEEVSSK